MWWLILLVIILIFALAQYDAIGWFSAMFKKDATSDASVTGGEPEQFAQLNSVRKVTLWYTPWCGYCTRFKPTWNQLKENLSKTGVIFTEVNGDEVKVDYVKSYPTIIMLGENGHPVKYEGDRTLDGLTKWVLSPNLDGL
jgi:thiol-disulfide isomerase/thioredoxin